MLGVGMTVGALCCVKQVQLVGGWIYTTSGLMSRRKERPTAWNGI